MTNWILVLLVNELYERFEKQSQSTVIPFRNKDMIDAILIKFSSYIEQSDTILYVRDSSIQIKVACHIDTPINLLAVKQIFF